jgi:hypothetical protein
MTVRPLRLACLLAVLTAVMSVMASPAWAAPTGPVTVVPAGCDFDSVTGDAVVNRDATTRGFVSFHGSDCGERGSIWYFQGSGTSWTSARTSLRGRVLAVADDGSWTFLLFQAADGIWITKRSHDGTPTPGRRLSAFAGSNPYPQGDLVAFTNQWWAIWTEQVGPGGEFAPMQLFQGKTIGAGDCIDPINRQRISFNRGNDESPSLVLKPASAGASGADLVWSRNDGAQGQSGHIWLASADCTARWRSRQLSFAGQVDLEPDMFRYGNVNHVTWMRDELRIVYVNNGSGTYRGRTFLTRGVQPRVAASMGNAFVAWQNLNRHPFVAVYRNGQWAGRDLTPTANTQQLVVAVTAARGFGTVLAASLGSNRLYAIANI